MNRILPTLLIILGLGLGIYGFTKYDDSSASLQIGELELSAGNKDGKEQSYILFALGGVSLLAGLYLSSKK